jgi:hypothetical protein
LAKKSIENMRGEGINYFSGKTTTFYLKRIFANASEEALKKANNNLK